MASMAASGCDRVAAATSDEINEQIRHLTEVRLAYFAQHPDQIERRLQELDAEWDIERVLEVLSSSISLSGVVMSLVSSRRWLLVPLVVQSFFLQHALQGWCPPLPVLRSWGIRTSQEIESERLGLRMLRGDFGDLDREPRENTSTEERRRGAPAGTIEH